MLFICNLQAVYNMAHIQNKTMIQKYNAGKEGEKRVEREKMGVEKERGREREGGVE